MAHAPTRPHPAHRDQRPQSLAEHRQLAARLQRFWGRVVACQDAQLRTLVKGPRVLEIGCGYGALVSSLRAHGLTAIGVDMDQAGLQAGREVLGDIPVVVGDAYRLPFADQSFDTVVFRDSLHHLESDRALAEAARLTRGRVIVFESNMMPALRVARRLVGHESCEALPMDEARRMLHRSGWTIERVEYRDVIALPLSGGYIGPELVPNARAVEQLVLALDTLLSKLILRLQLGRWCCWRYVVVATPPAEMTRSPQENPVWALAK